MYIAYFATMYTFVLKYRIGGVAKSVPLRLSKQFDQKISANDWILNPKDLECAIGERTKAIILNSPHNPTGKIFSEEELSFVAQVAVKHNLLVISDEVVGTNFFEFLTMNFSMIKFTMVQNGLLAYRSSFGDKR